MEQESNGKELYELKRKQKKGFKTQEQRKDMRNGAPKNIGLYLLYTFISIGIIGGLWWFISTRPKLPPTSMQGHIEESPNAHIADTPISDAIQRHMLEHADGKGEPSIIIQYNCEKYICEPNLVEKLIALAKEYPDNVYLAPNNYDGKIILTKEGGLEILNQFDEQKIKDFIRR
ncbi:MAG: hypothetical protein Q8L47_04680 [bacterium]|nr:hypothetical protein [bacterium]